MFGRRAFLKTSAAVAAAGLASTRASARSGPPTPEQVYFDPDNPVLGNPNGDVTVAEFFDYQCPYCKRDMPTVRDVVKKDGNVRLVMKDWPIFGDVSIYACHLVLGAKMLGKYDTAFSAMMATKAWLSKQEIDGLLKDVALDAKELLRTYSDHADVLDAMLSRNSVQARAFALPVTPGYVIGRQVFRGIVDRNGLVEAIARAREPS